MQQLNFPTYDFKLTREGKKTKIFDEVRRKYLVLTPEEWVRQHLIKYLIIEKGFPKGLISIEAGLKLNQLSKRLDVLCTNTKGNKILLAECKAPGVKIDQTTFDQISRYNIVHQVPYLIVSNGMNHYCSIINFESKSFEFVKEIPSYQSLSEW